MYMFDEMVDGVSDKRWKSKRHRQVAIDICIRNPNVRTMDVLAGNIRIIQRMKFDELQDVTIGEMLRRGCVF